VTQKNSNRSSQRLLVLGTVVILCVLLVGGIWLVRGSMDLFTHITPSGSTNIALSTNMEPFDIALKSKVYDNAKGDINQTVEWDLKLPRAYVDDVQGKNGSVRHLVSTGAQDDLKVLLAVHVLADGQTLEPYTMMAADQKKFDDNTMVISLFNTDADWWIAKNNLCVQQEQFGKASDNVGGPPYEFAGTCFPTIKFCKVYTHLDGWLVTINASKQLYAQPEKVCSLAKKFVNQYTLKRDYFPIDVPTGYQP
jgi:hypothetical protein